MNRETEAPGGANYKNRNTRELFSTTTYESARPPICKSFLKFQICLFSLYLSAILFVLASHASVVCSSTLVIAWSQIAVGEHTTVLATRPVSSGLGSIGLSFQKLLLILLTNIASLFPSTPLSVCILCHILIWQISEARVIFCSVFVQ